MKMQNVEGTLGIQTYSLILLDAGLAIQGASQGPTSPEQAHKS